jgi:hypothetical protein
MESIGGPLFQLRWMGLLCPCLEKEESRNARQALQHVNTASKRILWNTASSGKGPLGTAGFSLGGLFGGGSSKAAKISSTVLVAGSDKNAVAALCIRDSAEGYSEIYVNPLPNQAVSYKLQIALKRVHAVQVVDATSDDIILTAKPVGGSSSGKHKRKNQAPPKELLRFSVLQDTSTSTDEIIAVPSDQRNLMVHHLSVMVEWERQRRAANGDDDWDEDEEDQPNFLQARAQKAAHFANREIEMQQTKRDRDKRKAKLVAESGGLKYTALAMANMK